MASDPASEIDKSPTPLEFIPARQPQQRRSHAAYERMIEAAGHLLEERDFDSMSIRDLAGAAGCSIGSFYYRFQTKERFFQILIQDIIEGREKKVRETFQVVPLAELPSALARGALTNYRTYKGLLRSVIKKHLEGMRSWEPISLMGRRDSGRPPGHLDRTSPRPISAIHDRQGQQAPARRLWLTPVFRPIATRTPSTIAFLTAAPALFERSRHRAAEPSLRWAP